MNPQPTPNQNSDKESDVEKSNSHPQTPKKQTNTPNPPFTPVGAVNNPRSNPFTPVRPANKPEDDPLKIYSDNLLVLTDKREGLNRLMKEYLKIEDRCPSAQRLALERSLDILLKKEGSEKALEEHLENFLDGMEGELQFRRHHESGHKGTENWGVPDYGLYVPSCTKIDEDSKTYLDYSRMLVLLELKIGFDDPIARSSTSDLTHNGINRKLGFQFIRFIKAWKSARQAPYYVYIYIFGKAPTKSVTKNSKDKNVTTTDTNVPKYSTNNQNVEKTSNPWSFRLMIGTHDNFYTTESLEISECKQEFITLLFHFTHMEEKDFNTLQRTRRSDFEKKDPNKKPHLYVMEARSGIEPFSAPDAPNTDPDSNTTGNQDNDDDVYFKEQKGIYESIRGEIGISGPNRWFFSNEKNVSVDIYWAHTEKPTEDKALHKIFLLPENQSLAFPMDDIDWEASGTYKHHTNDKIGRSWLTDNKLRLSEKRKGEYDANNDRFKREFFVNRKLVVVTFKKVYSKLTEIKNLQEWLVIFTQSAIYLESVLSASKLFHTDITPRSLVFERLSEKDSEKGSNLFAKVVNWEHFRDVENPRGQLQYDRTGVDYFQSPRVQHRVGIQSSLDDFFALLFVHVYMLHFFDQRCRDWCKGIFEDPRMKAEYAYRSGSSVERYSSLEQSFGLSTEAAAPLLKFNTILREILKTRYLCLHSCEPDEIKILLEADDEKWNPETNQTLIDVFVIACRIFLAFLTPEDHQPLESCIDRLKDIKVTQPELASRVLKFMETCSKTKDMWSTYAKIDFVGGKKRDPIAYLYWET